METLMLSPPLFAAAGYSLMYLLGGGGVFFAFKVTKGKAVKAIDPIFNTRLEDIEGWSVLGYNALAGASILRNPLRELVVLKEGALRQLLGVRSAAIPSLKKTLRSMNLRLEMSDADIAAYKG